MVENTAQLLGDRFPELFLLDSLYFNQPFFKCVRSKGAHQRWDASTNAETKCRGIQEDLERN